MHSIAPIDDQRAAVALNLFDYEIKRNRAVIVRDFKSAKAVEPAAGLAEYRIGERIVGSKRTYRASLDRKRERSGFVRDLRPEVAQVEPLARARLLALEEHHRVFGLYLHRLRGKRAASQKERGRKRGELGCECC